MKESVRSFLSSMLSVILGIFITFMIQGMIDRSHDRQNARSSLELVRSELAQNIEDISTMRDYMYQEKQSAEYILANMDTLDKCPVDSLNFHSGIIFADVSFTLCQDALELLKMSSVFQKIENNDLSMKIIRAYDASGTIVSILNRHIASRDARFENSIDKETAGVFATGGSIDIKEFVKTDYGKFAIKWLTTQPDPVNFTDFTDLEEAISAINKFLKIKDNEEVLQQR